MIVLILNFAKEDIYFIDSYLRNVIVFSLSRAKRMSKLIRIYPINYDPSSFVLTYPKSNVYKCYNNNLCLEFSNSLVFTSLQIDSTKIYILKPNEIEDSILKNLKIPNDENILIFKVSLSILPDTTKPKIKYVYSYVSLSFIFPYGFEIFNYTSDIEGKWRMVKNVINFYALNVQKLNLYIAFKPNYDTLTRELYKLSSESEKFKCFEPYKVKDEIDFDIGSAEIKDEYKPVLEKIYYDIDWKNIKELIIEGYADSLPIRGELTKKYPSNWELSSARALSVAKYLMTLGAPANKLKLTYTGEYRKSQRKVEFYIVR